MGSRSRAITFNKGQSTSRDLDPWEGDARPVKKKRKYPANLKGNWPKEVRSWAIGLEINELKTNFSVRASLVFFSQCTNKPNSYWSWTCCLQLLLIQYFVCFIRITYTLILTSPVYFGPSSRICRDIRHKLCWQKLKTLQSSINNDVEACDNYNCRCFVWQVFLAMVDGVQKITLRNERKRTKTFDTINTNVAA